MSTVEEMSRGKGFMQLGGDGSEGRNEAMRLIGDLI